MFHLNPEDTTQVRTKIRYSADNELTTDIGYFMMWYAASELAFTNLLAIASRASDLEIFETLCSGMDFRVKLERFRRLRRERGGIGPNLDSRLKYMNDKCRPIRNRLAHCTLSRSEKQEGVYLASTLATLPWDDLQMELPQGMTFKPPITYSAAQLLGWGVWLSKFVLDLAAACRNAGETGEFEITNPQTPEPPADQGIPSPLPPRAKGDKKLQTPTE